MNPTNPIHSSAGIWAGHVFWGVTILLMVAAVLSGAGRHRPTVRHGLWLGALIGVLGLPVLIGLADGLGWRLASMHIALPSALIGQAGPAATASFHSRANVGERGAGEVAVPFENGPVGSGDAASIAGERPPRSSLSRQASAAAFGPAPSQRGVAWALVLLAWGLGSALLALRWTVGSWQVKRLLREAQAPAPGWRLAERQQVCETLSLSELPPILLCRRARVPMVAGLRHPRVILPLGLATDMSPAELTDTLIHECAHIRRRDQWVLLLQRVGLAVFWPHPLLHYLNRELERAREELCDNHVLTASRASAYAETLLRLAQICLPAPQWGATMTMFSLRTPLEERIRRLVDKRRKPSVSLGRWPRLGVALVMGLLTAGISSTHIYLRAAPVPANPESALELSRHANPVARVQAASQPASEVDQKVAELTRGWSHLRLFEDVEIWAAQIQELVQIGPPAVPALTAQLDRTRADLPLRLLGFTLRAIGDPRAVPSLIRAIPRTLRRPGSDCGVNLEEGELKDFMLMHHDSGPKQRNYIDLNRPVREICTALRKITGTTLGEEEAYHTFLEGEGHQRDLQRQVYDRIAHRWADWWGTNWNRFVADPGLATVALAPLSLSGEAGPGQFPTGSNVKVSGGNSNVGICPVEKSGAWCFLDLDTGRHPAWPKALADSAGRENREALWAWAAQEGIDLSAVTYRAPGADKDYYCLKAVGLQAWEVPNERWDTVAEEVAQDLPMELGRPAGELLMHYDSEQACYVPNRRATFLFITREGTPGILRLTTQVLPPGTPLAQTDSVVAALKRYGLTESRARSVQNQIPPDAAFWKRYGLPPATQDLSGIQEEEEAGFEPIGVKIEYKFFVRESED